MMSELRIDGLDVGYGGNAVLRQVNMHLEPGEYACLLGRSGSGKSTLLGAVAGFVKPDHGRIHIGDTVVFDSAAGVQVPPQARGLGMVFQEPTLWPHLRVIDNILFPLRSRGLPANRQLAEGLLDRVGLTGLGERMPEALSGGQRQRVAICRALAAQPALVLLDEPLSAVDSLTREELRSYLHLLFADTGTTALHVTHDPAEAFALARHVGVIERGQIVQWDTPQALYRQPQSEVVAGLTGAFRSVEVMAEPLQQGQARVRFDDRDWICPAHPHVKKGKARLVLRPESIRFADRKGPWRLLNRRFDAGSFYIEAQNPRGDRIQGLSTQNLPLDSVSVELSPPHCWLLPDAPGLQAETNAATSYS